MKRRPAASRRGSILIEFALSTTLLMTMFFGLIEFCRVILVINTVANAARVAARYAATHGASRTGSGAAGPSGPGANPTQVVTVANNWTAKSMLNNSNIVVTVNYPDGTNTVGSRVSVAVAYPYDPFFRLLSLPIRLGSVAEGVITQ